VGINQEVSVQVIITRPTWKLTYPCWFKSLIARSAVAHVVFRLKMLKVRHVEMQYDKEEGSVSGCLKCCFHIVFKNSSPQKVSSQRPLFSDLSILLNNAYLWSSRWCLGLSMSVFICKSVLKNVWEGRWISARVSQVGSGWLSTLWKAACEHDHRARAACQESEPLVIVQFPAFLQDLRFCMMID